METKRRIATVFVVLLVFWSGCKTLEQSVSKPRADVKDVKFGEITPESATLLFDVEIENPYSVDLPLQKISFVLSSQEKPLFWGRADLQTIVPSKSIEAISLPVQVGYSDVLNAFKGFTSGLKIPYEAQVNLSFDTPDLGMIRLSLKKAGQISVPDIGKISEND